MSTTEYWTSFTWSLPQWLQEPRQQSPRRHDEQLQPQPHPSREPHRSSPRSREPQSSERSQPVEQDPVEQDRSELLAGGQGSAARSVEHGWHARACAPPCMPGIHAMPGMLCIPCMDRDIISPNMVMGQHIICPNISII